MDIINRQITIAQIPLNISNILIEEQYIDDLYLYIPIDLSTCETSSLEIALCEENDLDYEEVQGQFTYELTCNTMADKSNWDLNVMAGDYRTAFVIEFDEGEELALCWALIQDNILK